MTTIKRKPLVILDFGSQYTQLIARRVREMGVYCEIHPYNLDVERLKTINPCGVILSGGPSTVTLDINPRAPEWLFSSGIPLLGICYGMQTMAVQLGGQVQSSDLREFGYAELRLHGHSELLENIEDRTTEEGTALLDVWMSHGDKVAQLPPDFEVICETRNAPIAGMAHKSKPWYGLQFHPEVTHTLQGLRILQRFVIDICHAETNWTADNIIDEAIHTIRQQVGNEQVVLGLSGGVDSSVVAALLHKAIGKQLICVFVDTGLLRLNEKEQVMTMFGEHMGIKIIAVDAEDKFLNALKGVDCPEKKRKIIGHTFIDIFDEEAQRLPNVRWLAQGTIYPDVIESAATQNNGASMVIKSHHNVGGLPETLNLKLLEPLRELFKDEVRKIGLELGLPYEMVYRHPFPGPGLGVRILGEVKKEYAEILRQADAIFIEELKEGDLYHKVSQAFAVFLPVKSVGVMGDGRRYDYVICLRAVETIDFMTAHWAQLPWDFLGSVSNRIINEVSGVSRVTYDISGKPPATIEWE
ncbi:glutamine-hydrolyzing GMP synthase [Legionella jamestowniensis]|uniref:GMP synthase [glutamine-hydrolyzing] n=1 Tax=Legionella jamestowniensis TaxID=455 RepID=A0A0W0UJP7_9GAMM|nr:glutamine-hydrolyzing GMP synthase [Legionella jamestowniensis]KTD08115.1 GMP synthase [Legionella jamestowniensis]OCH97499.1 glutamine-hydrolyzing GMP synthase [Legionella jamestowniensis]SFM09024.1 GMP synthase (glutamine-hydrolyzing) [Legionella jamestowniensis DSM 19215]